LKTETSRTGIITSKRDGEESGFSLVEVLFSLLLLTVIMLMTAKLMTSEIGGSHYGRLLTEATGIATDMIEKLMEVDYQDIDEFDGFTTKSTPPPSEPAGSYCEEWKETILDVLPGGYGEIQIDYGSNLSRMTVIVKFRDGGIEHEVKLETMRNNVL